MDEARQCRATSKRSGERCRRAAIVGGRVCPAHGGKAPAVKAKALQRVAEAEAESFVAQLVDIRGPLTLGDVYCELLRTAALAVEWRNILESKVADLNAWRYTAYGPGTEQLRSEVALFERAMDRTAKVLELIVRLDIDARAKALTEYQGDLVATAVQRILNALDLTPAQLALVPVVVPRELRRVVLEDTV